MATIVTRYVDPNSSGGNGTTNALSGANAAYASLFSWEANRRRNLVSADEIEKVICSSNDGGEGAHLADTTYCAIDVGTGWTVDSGHFIYLQGATKPGAKWNDNIYRMIRNNAGSFACLQSSQTYTLIDGMQFQRTGTGSGNVSPLYSARVGSITRNCFIRNSITSGTYAMGCYSGGENNVYIYNNVYLLDGTLTSKFGIYSYWTNFYAWNCTVICKNGYTAGGGVRGEIANCVNAKNLLVRGFGDGFAGNLTVSSDYNSSDISGDAVNTGGSGNDNTASPWYSGATADADIFVDAANNDYHLKPGTIFKGVGTNLSVSFTEDIDGQTRPFLWDLGADQQNFRTSGPFPFPKMS
jgi:hypothetical protein